MWLIVLDPGDAACRQRNLQRDDQFAFDGYDQLVGGMRRAFGPRAWWVDSSEQIADETLETICARAGLGR